MSDLISRQAVLDFIEERKTFTAYTENGIRKNTNNYVNSASLNGFVMGLPTAYDVDNVVSRIYDNGVCVGSKSGFVLLEKAVAIIKGGAIK